MWKWSARVAQDLAQDGLVDEIVVAAPKDCFELIKADADVRIPFSVVEGGSTRSKSVLNGLKACGGSYVMVHDGARPFVTRELCLKIMRKAEETGCAIPLLPLKDSLEKRSGKKLVCVNRADFYRVQTPQAFERERLVAAIESSGESATDEASQWKMAGNDLHSVEGDERNFKITDAFDWAAANAFVNGARQYRVGNGYDVHTTSPGRRLILAGVELKDAGFGLLGHSDADVVTHALMDAILGAAGEPDIGTIFPASSDEWKDADSLCLLDDVMTKVRRKGWAVEWADVTIVAQKPRIGHLISEFRANLLPHIAETGAATNLNMKVKSPEGCGSAGRGECIVCYASALLSRIEL